METFEFVSLSETRSDILSGRFSAAQLVDHYLAKASNEDHYNAFLEVFESSARESAKQLDQRIAAGFRGRLLGAVIAIKDNLCLRDHRVGASSKILDGFESLYTATAVQRLIDEGAIIIGRTNCDEFAMGSSNENSAFGAVKNPIDATLVPGGSSGGSAAAVAAGLCMASLGSDTGGSIRQPASFTGTVGLKPSYGRISRYGLIAFASSFDQIGPFTKNVDDAELLFDVMAGHDPMDSTSYMPEPLVQSAATKRPLKFAVFNQVLESEGLHPEVKRLFESKLENLKAAGHTIHYVDFPYLQHIVPCYYVLTTAEASSNLSRYDGVHFGYRSKEAKDIPSTYFKSRTEGFGDEVKRRIMLGTFVLSSGYYDAYYSKAQKVRRLIKNAVSDILGDHDFILNPTTPHTAFELGSKVDDPIALYLEDVFTATANLSGNPAISLPMGEVNGLPIGIQLTADNYRETDLFDASKRLVSLF